MAWPRLLAMAKLRTQLPSSPLRCSLCGFTSDNCTTDIPLYVHHLDTEHPGRTWAIFVKEKEEVHPA